MKALSTILLRSLICLPLLLPGAMFAAETASEIAIQNTALLATVFSAGIL